MLPSKTLLVQSILEKGLSIVHSRRGRDWGDPGGAVCAHPPSWSAVLVLSAAVDGHRRNPAHTRKGLLSRDRLRFPDLILSKSKELPHLKLDSDLFLGNLSVLLTHFAIIIQGNALVHFVFY